MELRPKFLERPPWDRTHYSKLKAKVTNVGPENVRLMVTLTSFGFFDRFGSETMEGNYLIPAGNTWTKPIRLKRALYPSNPSCWHSCRYGLKD